MASIFLRGNVWWALYYEQGKKIQHSLRTKDKKVAKFKKNEIENRLAKGESPLPDTTITVQKCFDEYKQSREGMISKQTGRIDYPRIQKFINEERILRFRDITEARLKAHLDDRIEAGISRATANHTIRALKTFLSFCIRRRYIFESPLKFMPRYPVDKIEPRFLSADEVKKLLAAARRNPIEYMLLTALYTGMRLGEIEALKWEDIDFENNRITVAKSKSKKFRKIPIHEDLKAVLWKARRTSGPCFEPRTREALQWQFEHIKARMNDVPHFRFHDLRHTFASMMIKSGVDIYTLSKLLGHSSVSTTEIYAHLYDDHAQEAIGKLKF